MWELLVGIVIGWSGAVIMFLLAFAVLFHLGKTWARNSVIKAFAKGKVEDDEEGDIVGAKGPIIADDEREWKRGSQSGAY